MRLAAVLTMAKTDPADGEYPPEAFVFGEHGERVGTIKKAWETTVLKAHGVKPVRRRAWQTRRNGGGHRATAVWPRQRGGIAEGTVTLTLATMCARSSGG
jgi:hypothetical protein